MMSNGAFSSRTRSTPGPCGSLLVSEPPRPDSRAARSTTTSSDSFVEGRATVGPAEASSGPTDCIHARSACFLPTRSCALVTELSSGSEHAEDQQRDGADAAEQHHATFALAQLCREKAS